LSRVLRDFLAVFLVEDEEGRVLSFIRRSDLVEELEVSRRVSEEG